MLDLARLDADIADNDHINVAAQPRSEGLLPRPQAAISRAAIIGNFPPRQCGIATFTHDMLSCLNEAAPGAKWDVAAMTDEGGQYNYPAEVTHVVAQNDPASYLTLARQLNSSGVQVVFIQHEFGIFGGSAGDYLLPLMRRLRMPIVVTLHTVLERPDADQRRVMKEILRLSAAVIVMADKGAEILQAVYKAGPAKVHVIPHGAPSRSLSPTEPFKASLGLSGAKVIMTFGLLSPNKGLETMVRALPRVLEQHPDTIYLIAGATHPHLVAREGEAYREGLVELARSLGVDHALKFVNRFIDNAELFDLLQAADVYVTPYLSEAQITSGTLSYAIALGKPVVSTPYWHAAEALAEGVGILCPFNDVDAFSREIIDLLSNDVKRNALARKAWKYGTASRWPQVGKSAVDLATAVLSAHTQAPRQSVRALAHPRLDALKRLSDDTGIFQHAKYRVPDRAHGYCIDDTARALMLASRMAAQRIDLPAARSLSYAYAGFIDAAWNAEAGRFRNFLSWDRRWLDEGGCDDCNGRTLQALCVTAVHGATQDLRDWATDLARRAYQRAADWTALRCRAHLIQACTAAEGVVLEAREVEETLRRNAEVLMGALAANRPWFEDKPSYENARLPEALILAGRRLQDRAIADAGLAALAWLMDRQTVSGGHFRPIATSSFADSGASHPAFDQQPLEIWASVDACATAYAHTGDRKWLDLASGAFCWFAGENDLGLPLVTLEDGGCYDGLTAAGCNQNQGAESVLSYHLAAATMRQILGPV